MEWVGTCTAVDICLNFQSPSRQGELFVPALEDNYDEVEMEVSSIESTPGYDICDILKTKSSV